MSRVKAGGPPSLPLRSICRWYGDGASSAGPAGRRRMNWNVNQRPPQPPLVLDARQHPAEIRTPGSVSFSLRRARPRRHPRAGLSRPPAMVELRSRLVPRRRNRVPCSTCLMSRPRVRAPCGPGPRMEVLWCLRALQMCIRQLDSTSTLAMDVGVGTLEDGRQGGRTCFDRVRRGRQCDAHDRRFRQIAVAGTASAPSASRSSAATSRSSLRPPVRWRRPRRRAANVESARARRPRSDRAGCDGQSVSS